MSDIAIGTGASGNGFSTARGGATVRAEAVGEYTQTLLLELRQMAIDAGCGYLVYLLELSLIEASDLAAGRAPSAFTPDQGQASRHPDIEEIARRILSARG